MHFLITGGAGFIGQHLTKVLIDASHTVTILDMKPSTSDSAKFAFGDIADLNTYKQFINHQLDCVIHLASVVGVASVSHQRLTTVNTIVNGTLNVLQFCTFKQIPCISFSSSEVYGNSRDVPFCEQTSELSLGASVNSRWSYAAAKMCAEHLALAYHEELGLPVTVIRPFNVVGQGQKTKGMVIPTFIEQALNGEDITVQGNGSAVRCFLAVQDAVEAIAAIATRNDHSGQIFNLGNPNNQISILELAHLVRNLAESNSEIKVGVGNSDIQKRIPDISKIQKFLNWTPKRDLHSILLSLLG